jgi:hypothetical protein
VDRRRYLRRVQQQGCTVGESGRLHPGGSARLHRLQPGKQPRHPAGHSAATGNNITVSFYYSLALGKPVIEGGDPYRWNIANCNKTIYHWKDPLTQEPGAMEGPTIQGADALIARDPNARWNDVTNKVEGSAYGGQSPRVFPIPLYDPIVYDSGKRNGRGAELITANWIGFFLESTEGNGINGRIIPIAGIRDGSGPAPTGLNPITIRLVQ